MSETFDRDALLDELHRDEGLRLVPYRDTTGHITIGIGRNLSDVGISEAEAEMLCSNDVDKVLAGLDVSLPWWRQLDDVRQRVLINMGFNLGVHKLMSFARFIASVKDGNYALASTQMLMSKWAGQVGARAERLSEMMKTGEAEDV